MTTSRCKVFIPLSIESLADMFVNQSIARVVHIETGQPYKEDNLHDNQVTKIMWQQNGRASNAECCPETFR